jgi:hypothetical protein
MGTASGRKAGQISFVLCHQPKSFDWRLHKAKMHPLKTLSDAKFAEVQLQMGSGSHYFHLLDLKKTTEFPTGS